VWGFVRHLVIQINKHKTDIAFHYVDLFTSSYKKGGEAFNSLSPVKRVSFGLCPVGI
jgi:hypothetical protein